MFIRCRASLCFVPPPPPLVTGASSNISITRHTLIEIVHRETVVPFSVEIVLLHCMLVYMARVLAAAACSLLLCAHCCVLTAAVCSLLLPCAHCCCRVLTAAAVCSLLLPCAHCCCRVLTAAAGCSRCCRVLTAAAVCSLLLPCAHCCCRVLTTAAAATICLLLLCAHLCCFVVQEKSRLDWQQFKSSEGLKDELAHSTDGG